MPSWAETYSVVVIVPANKRAAAVALGAALGHVGAFNIALSDDGENISHYGLHTWSDENFKELYENTPASIPGHAPAAVNAIKTGMIFDSEIYGLRSALEHWQAVLDNKGLQELQGDLE